MIISDLSEIEGRHFPARRRTQPFAGAGTPIPTEGFGLGMVTFEPNGGQVPWHNQEQEEIYFVIEGEGEMCLGSEKHGRSAIRSYPPPADPKLEASRQNHAERHHELGFEPHPFWPKYDGNTQI